MLTRHRSKVLKLSQQVHQNMSLAERVGCEEGGGFNPFVPPSLVAPAQLFAHGG